MRPGHVVALLYVGLEASEAPNQNTVARRASVSG